MIYSLLNKFFALIKGLFTVFKHSFKHRVTLEYPEKKHKRNERFRGKHVWDHEKCIGCKVCERVCPADAIKINRAEDGKCLLKLDLSKCIFCGNCVYYCKKEAIKMSDSYELATYDKNSLNIEINN